MKTPKFVFVVGIGRSGTSLLQNMLNAHQQICFLPENSFLRRYLASGRFDSQLKSMGAHGLASELASDVAFKRIAMSPIELGKMLERPDGVSAAGLFRVVARAFLNRYGSFKYAADKDPRLVEFLPTLHVHFPDAKVIHIYRDPRDVVLSKTKAEWSKGRPLIVNLFSGRVQWSLVRRNGRSLFGSNFHELAYEDLIRTPRSEMAKICEFLGLDFESEVLTPSAGGRALVADDELSWKSKSLGPILSDNTEKWRKALPPAHIALTEAIARRMMVEARYQQSNSIASLSALARISVLAQSVIVSLVEPAYCWYRTWTQRT